MPELGLKTQIAHLKKDRKLKAVIEKVGPLRMNQTSDVYLSLMKAIVSQQLSVKAADTIWNRFLELFKDGYPNQQKLLKLSDEKLRSVGLSYQKAGYLKNIAKFSIDETLEHGALIQLNDDELVDYLIQIKGVGRWTVEMLMMFSLNRLDVLPKDDLGIQNGMINLYGIKATGKRELYAEMEKVAERWKPYRSLACRYIWRFKNL